MCAQNNEKVVTRSYDRYGKGFLIAHNSRWEVGHMTSGREMLSLQVIGLPQQQPISGLSTS